MSNHPFSGLTDAQAERLAMLIEEAGEVVQAIVYGMLKYGDVVVEGRSDPRTRWEKKQRYTHHQGNANG